MIKRKKSPYKGYWALPGGKVHEGETAENACIREVFEETNLCIAALELLGVYSELGRDPRGHYTSIVFVSGRFSGRSQAGSDAQEVSFFQEDAMPNKLAFDHRQMLEQYHEAKKLESKSLL